MTHDLAAHGQAIASSEPSAIDRALLIDYGLIRLDGIGAIRRGKEIEIEFDPEHHAADAWHYANDIGIIVLGRELWFWFGELTAEMEELANSVCSHGRKGRMYIPFNRETYVNAMHFGMRVRNPNWQP